MPYNRDYYKKNKTQIKNRIRENYNKKEKQYIKNTFQEIREKFGFSDKFIKLLLMTNTKTEILNGTVVNGKFYPKLLVRLQKSI